MTGEKAAAQLRGMQGIGPGGRMRNRGHGLRPFSFCGSIAQRRPVSIDCSFEHGS